MVDLSKVSTEELEDALLRRRKWREEHEPKPTQFCDECSNFVFHHGDWDDMQAKGNPCKLSHKMSFRMPDGPATDDWGYYRPGCKDRAPKGNL